VFQLEKITFIYWPIECISKAWFVSVFQLERTNFIYWPIECTSKAWFVRMFQLERTNFIYWPINVPQELDLLRWANLKELPSSIGQSMYSKNLICQGVPTWKNYLHLLVNWMHSKSFIYKTSPIWKHSEKGTFIYGWDNYLHMLPIESLMGNPFFSTNMHLTWHHLQLHFNCNFLNI
jgi:hypothetical protein